MKNRNILLATFAALLLSNVANAQQGFGTNSPKSTVDINGSFGTTITEFTNAASVALNETHQTIVFRGTTGSFTLPVASTCPGREYLLVNYTNVAVTTTAVISIQSTTTTSIPAQTYFKIKSNGTSWVAVLKSAVATADGSETKIVPADVPTTKITGTGTTADPYKVGTKFFYMPSIYINTATLGGPFTKDLWSEYNKQFNVTNVSGATANQAVSTGAPATIPNYLTKTDLYYYVTYYDNTVFGSVTIDANGLMSYQVIGTPTEASFMNIIFVVK